MLTKRFQKTVPVWKTLLEFRRKRPATKLTPFDAGVQGDSRLLWPRGEVRLQVISCSGEGHIFDRRMSMWPRIRYGTSVGAAAVGLVSTTGCDRFHLTALSICDYFTQLSIDLNEIERLHMFSRVIPT